MNVVPTFRSAGLAGALSLMLAPMATEAAAATCPDAATVEAARLVEFQTMMMGVAVRCRHVGVPIAEHLESMNTARRTVFIGANDRVAAYLRSLTATPASTTAPLSASANTPARSTPPAPGKPPVTAAKPVSGKARKGLAATTSAVAPSGPARPAAKGLRRTDPYDRYLTMIGNQYGGGVTTLQRCKAFDAIAVSLADKTYTDRLLTMISSSLVQTTLLEAIVNCPPEK